jgi:hypothetical protein
MWPLTDLFPVSIPVATVTRARAGYSAAVERPNTALSAISRAAGKCCATGGPPALSPLGL